MNIPRIRRHLLAFLIGAALAPGAAAFGQDTSAMLSQSLDLVRQVENPKGAPPTDAQRIDRLAQAIKTAQAAPNHRLQGHRVLAIQAIRSAIAAIRNGDPEHAAAGFLQTADAELSASISLAGGAVPPVAASTSPSPTTNVATPPVAVSPEASNAMRLAAENGHLDKVKALLQENPGLALGRDKDGDTPLLEAASGGHTDVVELLLDNKADVNARNSSGQTPLLVADKEVAALLLARGADINARDNNGTTALIGAAGDGSKDLVEFLLTKGAAIDAGDNAGCTALTWAAIQGHRDVAEVLIAHQADVNAKSPCGQTALNSAAMNGHKDVAELLLAHHADIHARAKDGETALDWAVNNGHLDMVEFLLAHGADINARANDGSTPLRLAERAHNYDVAAYLRQHGGKEPDGAVAPAVPTGTGDASNDPAALQAAAGAGDLPKVKALLQADPTLLAREYDFGVTPLIAAANHDRKDVVEFLLADHADVNARDFTGQTALSHAAQSGSMDMAELLLAHQADVNIGGNLGQTPLYLAANYSHKDMVELLLAHQADVNVADTSGLTALHMAAMMNGKDMVELLLAHGADINARGRDGKMWAGDTPLYMATRNGAKDVVEVLLARHADAGARGVDGLTPLEVAEKYHFDEVADLLRHPETVVKNASIPPIDLAAAREIVTRLVANASGKPPGPVEDDITEQSVRSMEAMAQGLQSRLHQTAPPLRESLAGEYNQFTLDGPFAVVHSQGPVAVVTAKVTMTPAALADWKSDPPSESSSWTVNGREVTDTKIHPGFSEVGGCERLESKVRDDGHVVATFGLLQQEGRWKVHCVYLSNDPIADDMPFIVDQLTALANKPPPAK